MKSGKHEGSRGRQHQITKFFGGRRGNFDRRNMKVDEGRQRKFLDGINKINGIGRQGEF
jgi:hypothetical protein